MQTHERTPMAETFQAGPFVERAHLSQRSPGLSQAILLPPTRRTRGSFWKGLLQGVGAALGAALLLVGGFYLGHTLLNTVEPASPDAKLSLSQPSPSPREDIKDPALSMTTPEIAAVEPDPEEMELPAIALPAPEKPRAPKTPMVTEPKTSKTTSPKASSPEEPAPKTSAACDPDDVVCALINDNTKTAAPSYPNQLSRSEIEKVARRGIYAPCAVIGTGRVAIGATIDSDGRVVSAWGEGPLAECAASRLRSTLRFPHISAESQSFVVVVEVR